MGKKQNQNGNEKEKPWPREVKIIRSRITCHYDRF
jgi:hypothetical protein